MDRKTKDQAKRELLAVLSPLANLFADGDIQEIMVNGPDNVWVERRGKKEKLDIEIGEPAIRNAIAILARLEGKEAKEGTPTAIIDTRLNGMRIAAALAPTAVNGPMLCIRIHNPVVLRLADYVAAGAMTQDIADFLQKIVRDRKNVIVAGGTSSGKTTLLNALLAEIDPNERIFTIEDTQELKVIVPNWVPMEANEQAGISMRLLLRLALRSAPDRIIVGEVRGAEAYDLMQAANTGHDGSFATLHANSAHSALSRLENLVLASGVNWPHEAICSSIAETFNYVLFMAKQNGQRQLMELIELRGYDREAKTYQITEVLKRRKSP